MNIFIAHTLITVRYGDHGFGSVVLRHSGHIGPFWPFVKGNKRLKEEM